jgi:hypothetical protein
MSELSGIKDVDREILSKLDDKELLKTCSINKYTWEKVCDDAFLKTRLTKNYPNIEQYKLETETWKRFFLRAIHIISKLKEDYDFIYTFGDFEKQWWLFNNYFSDIDEFLEKSSKKGELDLVIYSLTKGANVKNNLALTNAGEKGYLDIVKYLLKHGAEIDESDLLTIASENNHLDIVKYLVENVEMNADNIDDAFIGASYSGNVEIMKYLVKRGANLRNERSLNYASEMGHLEAVKYLVENGVNIKVENNKALRNALKNNHLEIARYLISLNNDLIY